MRSLLLSHRNQERIIGPMVFIGPAVLFLLLFIVYPIGFSLWIGFHDFFLISPRPPSFVGLENYRTVFADPVFWKSARVTVIYTLCTVSISFVFAFFVALVFNRLRGQALLLSIILLPITVPPVVVGLMFKVIFVKNHGIADYLLTTIGIPAPNWIAEPTTALATLIGVAVWEDFPLLAIILMAGLKSIPEELYEAAALDGAGFLAELRHITIPVMRPVIGAVVILSAVNAIKVFDIPYTLTSGGPGTATLTMTYYANNVGFEIFRLGRAAASSIAIFVLVILSVVLLARVFLKEERD